MRYPFIVLGLLAITGCSSVPKDSAAPSLPVSAVHQDIVSSVALVLAKPEPQPGLTLDGAEDQNARIEAFLKDKVSITEQDKILYLLAAVRFSGADFIRNGDHFRGDKAAGWLRWKMMHRQYRSNPIVTGRDFVDRVCFQSNKTGVPYEVILSDGRRERLTHVMNDELLSLENAIHQKAMKNAMSSRESIPLGKAQDTVSVPVLLPATSN